MTTEELQAKVEKLQRFKDWVHKYLDDHGVPYHPPGTHGAEGCRIGDRMDWLMAQLKLWKPLTPEEAEKAMDEADAAPLPPERIAEIVKKATDPSVRITNDEQAQLAARLRRLEDVANEVCDAAVVRGVVSMESVGRLAAVLSPESAQ